MIPEKLKLLPSFLFKPYFNRLKLGEGGLVLFNLTLALALHKNLTETIILTVVSFIVLCTLYGYNDYIDCERDLHNPKKDIPFTRLICDNKKTFITQIIAIQLATILLLGILFSWIGALCLFFLYTTNFLYSQKLKSVPLADVVVVGLWGSLYTYLIDGGHVLIYVAAGVMTGIAHFFQTMTDETPDQASQVRTSAVLLKGYELPVLFILSVLLCVVLYYILHSWPAILGLVSFLAYLCSRGVTLSWYIARFSFFVTWLVILSHCYGSI